MEQKVSSPSQNLWLAKLLRFDYDIEYKKGRDNVVADALSRNSSRELFAIAVFTISTSIIDEVKGSWKKDKAIQFIIKETQKVLTSHSHYK